MKPSKTFFRKPTTELPLAVYYFSASHIDEKPQPLHRTRHLVLVLVYAGAVELYTTAGMQLLTPGDICILPPGTLHAFHTIDLQTRYTYLSLQSELFSFSSSHYFCKAFLLPLERGILKPPQLLRPGDKPYDEIHSQLQQLQADKEGSDGYPMELLRIAINICAALYPYCSRTENQEVSPPDGHAVSEKCLTYIQNHYRQKITLQELAAHVHLHPNYLCALFREQTGKTVFEQLTWVRIHEASKLLRSTDLTISQISAQCGFQDSGFFAKKFRLLLGRTPTAYRKKSRSQGQEL